MATTLSTASAGTDAAGPATGSIHLPSTLLTTITANALPVRATAVGQDAVLAGEPKCLVYYVISKLNKTYLAGDPKSKG